MRVGILGGKGCLVTLGCERESRLGLVTIFLLEKIQRVRTRKRPHTLERTLANVQRLSTTVKSHSERPWPIRQALSRASGPEAGAWLSLVTGASALWCSRQEAILALVCGRPDCVFARTSHKYLSRHKTRISRFRGTSTSPYLLTPFYQPLRGTAIFACRRLGG